MTPPSKEGEMETRETQTLDSVKVTRTVLVSYGAWRYAKEKADELGMSISQFVEQLIQEYRNAQGDSPRRA